MTHFLNPGEVLMSTPEMISTKRNKPTKDEDEVLEGIRNLWYRIVEKLENDPEMLQDLEKSLNDSLWEQGGWERVKIADGTYLNLLEPMIVSGDGWGRSPRRYLDKVKLLKIHPKVWLTPSDPRNNDPNLPYELTDEMQNPMYDPESNYMWELRVES